MGDICYYLVPRLCLVASEVKQILAHPDVEAIINEFRVATLLTISPGNQEHTYYQNIYYLPPGHCMLVTNQEARIWRYWDIDPHKKFATGMTVNMLSISVNCS